MTTKKIKNNVKGRANKASAKATLAIVTIITQTVIILLLVAALTMPRTCAEKNEVAENVRGALQANKKTTVQKHYGKALDGDHVMGKQGSKATVVMYVDMQCPACAQMMPYYRRVFEKYKDKAEFIIRYFVIEGHDYARPAAIAVEAAAAQGYYWEMLNKTFENRGDWAYVNSEERLTQRLTEVFEEATSGKGDKERFVKDLSNENLAKKVDNDHSTGRKDNINATPTIIVDSADIEFSESELSVEELMAQRIEKALE